MEKQKHPGGRPPKYKNVRELQEKIDEYFESCWVDKIIEVQDKEGNITTTNSRYQNRPYTIMGLILALGFTCRQSFKEYKAKPEFTDAIKQARSKIEMNIEEYLIEGKNAAGPIFWLKNNAEEKYRDKQDIEFPDENGKPQPINGGKYTDLEMAAKIATLLDKAAKRKKDAECSG